jgi:large subunit ribosomal protein L22
MEAKAKLRHVRISAKKMQPVAKMVRGESLPRALAKLQFTPKKGAKLLKKVLESARSNAAEKQIDVDTLMVKDIQVDRGPIMWRIMTGQRGQAHRIKKGTSHISVVVGDE